MNMCKLKWLLAALVFGLLVFSVSCSGTKDPGAPAGSETTIPETDSELSFEGSVSIVENGVSNFRIVRTSSIDQTIANSAKQLQLLIRILTNVEIPIVWPTEVQAGERLIVIGTPAGLDAVQSATDALDFGAYGYTFDGTHLMVIGRCDTTLNRAISKFRSALTSAVNQGDLVIEVGENGVFDNYDNWMTDVPEVGKSVSSIYDCGNQTYQLFYRNADATICEELEGLLTANGDFVRSQGGMVGENRVATYVRADGEVSYLYAPAEKTLRVVCQTYDDHFVTIPSVQSEIGYEKTGETQFALLPLNYSVSCKDPTDCSGFSAVMTLEDGRFIIIDGGYAADADGLYNYLSDHNRRTDGITVAAWILTHAHGDHIGCFKQFAKDYGKRVQVTYLITNALPDSIKPTAEANNTDLSHAEIWCGSFAGETKILKMHTGQSAWFCNVELQMLFTQETLYPSTVQYLNETSTVFRLRVNGQTILITADCELKETDALVKLWGSEVKADLYQINHHGYSGVTTELIKLVDPEVAFWPTSETTAAKRRWNAWYLELKNRMKLCIVADGDAVILTLPYHAGDSSQTYSMNFGKKESNG